MAAAALKRANPILEWLVALIGLVVVIGALGVLVQEALLPATPPDPILRVRDVSRAAGGWRVEVEAENRGRATAMALEVNATLTPPTGPPETAAATVDYLGGGSTADLTLMFKTDPRRGELELTVGGWSEP
ncbi:hypothetical protein BZG35_15905 [Brevundimonas sp. LM2]|uniref:hypothetical protein n=1 Tax=Brevundimonas sp. LM2 TaxID=1938605 RepID=UPI000983C0E3|nr:hypothetical protein [Brevundimonas sp. LM2]AQR62974.1 hypothetical protein BZG35_15905 [Brevundimonas sp. LM2]